MTTGFRDTALADIGRFRFREAVGGSPAEALVIRVRTATGLEEVWRKPAVLTAASDSSPYGAVASGTDVGVQTSSAEVIVTGGFPPYAASWTRTDSNPESWSVIYTDRLITPFLAASVPSETIQSSTWECTVTDSRGNTATSNEITANAQNFGTGL